MLPTNIAFPFTLEHVHTGIFCHIHLYSSVPFCLHVHLMRGWYAGLYYTLFGLSSKPTILLTYSGQWSLTWRFSTWPFFSQLNIFSHFSRICKVWISSSRQATRGARDLYSYNRSWTLTLLVSVQEASYGLRTWTENVSYLGMNTAGLLPPPSSLCHSKGISTSVWDAFVNVTNLMLAQDWPLVARYYS
jgi:hypothetical protein